MKKIIIVIAMFVFTISIGCNQHPTKQTAINSEDDAQLGKFFKTALVHKQGMEFLHNLCKQAGPRISGSPVAEKAVQVSFDYLKTIADTVYLQDVMVPHWVRGEKETAWFHSTNDKGNTDVRVCALGGSIGTGKDGLKGKVIEVDGIDSIKKMKRADIEGKIVFFNGHMDEQYMNAGEAYGKAVTQRWGGAMEAGKLGAIGVIVRSVTMSIDDRPHTGSMGYVDSITKIPAIAIATLDANLLSETLKKDPNTDFGFRTTCEIRPDTLSHNVIAEYRGSKYPNEYIVIGGHLDAWDMAEGAHDDGTGVTHASEVIRLMKETGYKPLHTIRVVFFMNEENGGKGADKYSEWVKETKQKHVLGIESDAGGFTPRGFSFELNDSTLLDKILAWKPLLEKYNCGELKKGGSGADVGKLKDCGVRAGFNPDGQRYFDHHHAKNDVFEEVHPRELELGAAAITSLAYLFDKYWK